MRAQHYRPVDPLFLIFPELAEMSKPSGEYTRHDFVYNAFFAAELQDKLLGRFRERIELYERFEKSRNRRIFQRMSQIAGFLDMMHTPGAMMCPKEWPEKLRKVIGEFDYTPEEFLWSWPIQNDYGNRQHFLVKESVAPITWMVHAYVTGVPMEFLCHHLKCTPAAIEQDMAHGIKHLHTIKQFDAWARSERKPFHKKSSYINVFDLQHIPRLDSNHNIIPINFPEP